MAETGKVDVTELKVIPPDVLENIMSTVVTLRTHLLLLGIDSNVMIEMPKIDVVAAGLSYMGLGLFPDRNDWLGKNYGAKLELLNVTFVGKGLRTLNDEDAIKDEPVKKAAGK